MVLANSCGLCPCSTAKEKMCIVYILTGFLLLYSPSFGNAKRTEMISLFLSLTS